MRITLRMHCNAYCTAQLQPPILTLACNPYKVRQPEKGKSRKHTPEAHSPPVSNRPYPRRPSQLAQYSGSASGLSQLPPTKPDSFDITTKSLSISTCAIHRIPLCRQLTQHQEIDTVYLISSLAFQAECRSRLDSQGILY